MSGCGQGVFDSGGRSQLSPGYPVLFFSNTSEKALLSSNADFGAEQWMNILLLLFSSGDGEGAEQENRLDSL